MEKNERSLCMRIVIFPWSIRGRMKAEVELEKIGQLAIAEALQEDTTMLNSMLFFNFPSLKSSCKIAPWSFI